MRAIVRWTISPRRGARAEYVDAPMLCNSAILAAHLHDPQWVIFDCRHDLTDPEKGGRQYAEAHVPGAHFASVEAALAGRKNGKNGRHPLPRPEEFAAFLESHGVGAQSTVVAYDDAGGLYAARLWWLVRWLGHERVLLLDGGWSKWVAEGGATTTASPVPSPSLTGLRSLGVAGMGVWSAQEVATRLADATGVLIDARQPERYRGEIEPIDRIAGHIPGALNRFYKRNLQADLTFRSPEELRTEFVALLGARTPERVGHQCGSGITACANIFAMEYAGLVGSNLYAGSWSEWISDGARPVARG